MMETIYRVTYADGTQCHTGYRALAEVWAKREGAVLAEIGLEVPPEQHRQTQRWELLPKLRRLASDFSSHPLSRGISDCEQAGEIMADAAAEIERLCRTRNAIYSSSSHLRRRIEQLEHDLIAERNACHDLALINGANAPTKEEWDMAQSIARAIRNRGTEHDAIAAQMRDVADTYAHTMAMHLECILHNYSGEFWEPAIRTLGQYREAMNAIHERESPTHMGEPVLKVPT